MEPKVTPVSQGDGTLGVEGVARLLTTLRADGYTVVGPTVRDGAIVYDELRSIADLPVGWTDVQEAGTYRLQRRDDAALFGYTVGPHAWKQFLSPARVRLFSARRDGDGFSVQPEEREHPRFAFLGVRACDLAAIAIQDRVFLGAGHEDPTYRAHRRSAFVIAVNCGRAAATCFCASMGTGPRARGGHDLAITEILDPAPHRFVVEAGSESGQRLLARLNAERASDADLTRIEEIAARTAARMRRTIETAGLRERLLENQEHPHWNEVAQACLTCANCTMACPTCFCSTVEDVTDLTGDHAERWRRWDSCFTLDFSHLHGGSVRQSARSRYRQWMTHKLATWFDQFGSSGCVGCGRCISWCPVGIDITAEVRAIAGGPADDR
jgi:sulfhydrogenase subunit beta (sulfur reductase)